MKPSPRKIDLAADIADTAGPQEKRSLVKAVTYFVAANRDADARVALAAEWSAGRLGRVALKLQITVRIMARDPDSAEC